MTRLVTLGGGDLDLATVVAVARGGARVEVGDWTALDASRAWLDRHVAAWRANGPVEPIYGVTTGFGSSRNVAVPPEEAEALQVNLLRSHAVGPAPGDADWFDDDVVRAAALLRANAFLAGRSAVRRTVVEQLVSLLNAGVHPRVPLRGSVGASGDLCPLAHFALVLIGEGEASVPDGEGRRIVPGARALRHAGLHPLALSYKEGLALINGTTISTACLALALVDAEALARTAEVACALSFEALGAHGRALDPQLHAARRQAGQEDAAAGLRALLLGSTHVGSTDDRQDAYSVRCAPQVLGASRDALSFARHVGETELSAVTDNPLVFALPGDAPPWDLVHHADNPRRFGREPDGTRAYSGGNFHGQPVAVAADVAALATCEIMSIAERRIALLANPATSRGLPAHLAADSGTSSGLMLAQYTAASLVSEGKTLAHPASVDSIPTGAGAEDHVSMSTWAARKARQVVDLATQVVALELLAAAQAVEWRSVLPEPTVEPAGRSRDEWRRLDAAFRGANVADVAAGLGAGAAAAYRAVREISPRVGADRPLAHDVTTLARAVRAGQFVEATAGATRPLRRLVLAPPA